MEAGSVLGWRRELISFSFFGTSFFKDPLLFFRDRGLLLGFALVSDFNLLRLYTCKYTKEIIFLHLDFKFYSKRKAIYQAKNKHVFFLMALKVNKIGLDEVINSKICQLLCIVCSDIAFLSVRLLKVINPEIESNEFLPFYGRWFGTFRTFWLPWFCGTFCIFDFFNCCFLFFVVFFLRRRTILLFFAKYSVQSDLLRTIFASSSLNKCYTFTNIKIRDSQPTYKKYSYILLARTNTDDGNS